MQSAPRILNHNQCAIQSFSLLFTLTIEQIEIFLYFLKYVIPSMCVKYGIHAWLVPLYKH